MGPRNLTPQHQQMRNLKFSFWQWVMSHFSNSNSHGFVAMSLHLLCKCVHANSTSVGIDLSDGIAWMATWHTLAAAALPPFFPLSHQTLFDRPHATRLSTFSPKPNNCQRPLQQFHLQHVPDCADTFTDHLLFQWFLASDSKHPSSNIVVFGNFKVNCSLVSLLQKHLALPKMNVVVCLSFSLGTAC